MITRFHIEDSLWCMLALLIFLNTDGMTPIFLFSAAVHELGHLSWYCSAAAASPVSGCPLPAVCCAIGSPVRTRRKDFLIAAAGPAAGLLFSLICGLFGFSLLAGAGILLNGFNLLPVPHWTEDETGMYF